MQCEFEHVCSKFYVKFYFQNRKEAIRWNTINTSFGNLAGVLFMEIVLAVDDVSVSILILLAKSAEQRNEISLGTSPFHIGNLMY